MTTTNPSTPQEGGATPQPGGVPASASAAASGLTTLQERPRRSMIYHARAFISSKPLGTVGLVIILFMAFLAIAAPLVAPKNPNKINAYDTLEAPGSNYILGSDRKGRDVASRVIYGARMSLLVGFSSVAIGCTAGFILAVTTAYIGRGPDIAAQFLVDVLLAFPFLILAIVIVTVLGASTLNIIMAISIGYVPWTARIVRSTVLTLKEREFVLAAVASGASQWRIMFRHIAPNCLAPFLVVLTAGIGGAIIAEATLSFLGLGLPPPTASWGRDLQEGASRLIESAPWLSIFPGIAISLTVYGFNLLGDALRDVFDPRLRTL